MTVRIATAQYPIERFGTLGAYMDKVSRWVAEAAATGAQLLVYPEYAAMEYAGYQGDAASALDAALATVADLMPEMDATIAELAARHGVHILASSGPRRGDGCYQSHGG